METDDPPQGGFEMEGGEGEKILNNRNYPTHQVAR